MDTKALRQKILDLAIRGKLVPQDPNDEPASVLLERIRAEKERLIAEGKIKRPKKAKTSSSESHYQKFVIPESWRWVSIDEIADVVTGSTPSKDHKEYYGGDVPFYKPSDLEQGLFTTTASDWLTPKGYEQARKLPKDSVLVTCIGATIGKTGRIVTEGSCNQQINAVILHNDILSEYFYDVCLSDYFQSEIKNNASATTLPILNKNNFSSIEIPLPPRNEQKRILEEVNKLFSIIGNIESCESTIISSIDVAKSKILELAMQGKLVPQDPADEPAADMLLRINPKARIITDNPHYPQLPDNWVLTTVKDAFTINPKNQAEGGHEAGFVPMANIEDGFSNSFRYEIRKWAEIKSGFTHFADGDIAVAKISPCLENRKSMVLQNLPNGIGAGTTELLIFRSDIIIPEFGLLFFKSDGFIKKCVGTFNGVVGQQRVGKNIVEEIAISVPPQNQQKEIIERVESLFSLLDIISDNLTR